MKLNTTANRLTLILMILTAPAWTAVTGWRSDGTGIYPNSKPALEWAPDKNVVWKTPTPDWGNGMPVIVGDRIFINAERDQLICVDRDSGKILWNKRTPLEAALTAEQKQKLEANRAESEKLTQELDGLKRELRPLRRDARRAGSDEERRKIEAQRDELQARIAEIEKKLADSGYIAMPPTQEANGYTSATPVSDGKRVYIVYGSGIVAAYDLDGNPVWCKYLEAPTHQWGHSTSPRLVDGKLIVHILSMTALNPDNGEIIWQTESPEGWGTPYIGEIGGEKILATAKGDIIRASDGKKLAGGLYDMPFGSPIIHEGVLIAVDEKGGVALKLADKIEGDQLQTEKLWSCSPPKDRYYSSPVVIDGVLYVCTRGNKVSAIDFKTGEILYTETLNIGGGGRSSLYGSFVYAGGYLLVSHEDGKTAVLKPGRTFEQVCINSLESSRSTPIFAGDLMYFRTSGHLYCIGAK